MENLKFEDGEYVCYHCKIYELRVINESEYFIDRVKVKQLDLLPVSLDYSHKFRFKYIMMNSYIDNIKFYKTSYLPVCDGQSISDALPLLKEIDNGIKYIHQIQRLIKDEGYIVIFEQ